MENLTVVPNSIEQTKRKIEEIYQDYNQRYGLWGWCTLNKAGCIVDYVNDICERVENPICVEVGVYGGQSVLPVALELKRHNKGTIYGIDPWKNDEATSGYDALNYEFWNKVDLERIYQIYSNMISEFELEEFVETIKLPSNDAKDFEEIDFLHIDGQHTEQALLDVKKFASKVSIDGYCFVDDVEWGQVSMVPYQLECMGFEYIKQVDNNKIFKRTRLQSYNEFYFVNKKNKIRNTVWTVDNFYENPDQVREFALSQSYVEGGFGRGFIGRRTEKQFLFPGLKDKFEQIMGKKITGWQSFDQNGKFQIAWAGEPLVYHCDDQRWGGMLYLTPDAPYQCGTTLYAHKKTRARNYYEDGWDSSWDLDIPGDPHLDGTPFEPVDVLGNVYNRLVIFDASCIHSASQYFGTEKENSRLWQMFFFDTED